jgi:hypothetical protein
MQMIVQDNVTEDLQARILLEIFPRIKDYFHRLGTSEDGQPANSCASEKVRICVVVDFVTSAAHAGTSVR